MNDVSLKYYQITNSLKQGTFKNNIHHSNRIYNYLKALNFGFLIKAAFHVKKPFNFLFSKPTCSFFHCAQHDSADEVFLKERINQEHGNHGNENFGSI